MKLIKILVGLVIALGLAYAIMDPIKFLVRLVVGLVGLFLTLGLVHLACTVFIVAFIGAARLFVWACDSGGFLGIVAYVAMWIFLFPLMLAICIDAGLIDDDS